MTLEHLRHKSGSWWDHLADGWRQLMHHAASALTRFRAGDSTNLPDPEAIDETGFLPVRGWALLGGELFEDDTRVVARLEVPGVDKAELRLEVRDDALIVSGEKRFTREETTGRWRVMQCAYGSFERVLPLPVPVVGDAARASYRDGVLRVELPKATPGQPRAVTIPIA